MPTLSASDYTAFVKAQAASLAYQNGAIPRTIQTSAQPYAIQSMLNANLLASQASYVAATALGTVSTVIPTTISEASRSTVTAARTDILNAATSNIITDATGVASTKTFTYTTSVSHGLVAGDVVTITGLTATVLTSVNVASATVTSIVSPTSFTIYVAAGAQDGTITSQAGRINIGPAAAATAYYTSSVAHGLSVGTSITITGFTTFGNPGAARTVTRVIDSTHFAVANVGSGVGSGTGSITNLVYYTTSVPHGLTAGQTNVNITGVTTFTATNLTVANVGSLTTFALTSATTGTAVSAQTGSITGYIYYKTATAHGLRALRANTSYKITGLSTAAFNLTGFTIPIVPDDTNFVVANSATGSAVTGATGTLTQTENNISRTVISGNARVLPFNGKGPVNNPKNLSTVHNSTSTTLSSGKFQQAGGLPLAAAKGTGTYAPVPQLARVDTKSTGAYRSVRQPV